jgi:hypothetical protein
MVTREGKGSLDGSLDLHEASVAGFSIVMFFEPLENLNVVCAFDEGSPKSPISLPSSVNRFFGYVAWSWVTMRNKSSTAS